MTERIAPLAAILGQIPDPRAARGCRYASTALLLLVIVGLLSGANAQRSAAWRVGRSNAGWARLRRLGFIQRRRPSPPTLHRLLRNVDVDQVEYVLGAWLQEVHAAWRRTTALHSTARPCAAHVAWVLRIATCSVPAVTEMDWSWARLPYSIMPANSRVSVGCWMHSCSTARR